MLIPLPPDYRPFLNPNLFLTPADVEVEEGYVEVVEGGREAAQSSEEALSVAKFHTCPACLGRGLCQVKAAQYVEMSIYKAHLVQNMYKYVHKQIGARLQSFDIFLAQPSLSAWPSIKASVQYVYNHSCQPHYSGGEPRLVDSVCIWATCGRRDRVPWQPAGGGLGPCCHCGWGRSLGDLGRSSVRQRQPTSWMPRH